MRTADIIALENRYVLQSYGRAPIVLERIG